MSSLSHDGTDGAGGQIAGPALAPEDSSPVAATEELGGAGSLPDPGSAETAAAVLGGPVLGATGCRVGSGGGPEPGVVVPAVPALALASSFPAAATEVPEGGGSLPGLGEERCGVPVSVVTVAVEPDEARTVSAAAEVRGKSELNELMMACLRRPVVKDDVLYTTVGAPFVATVRLLALERIGLVLPETTFVGEPRRRKVEAEHSAANQALLCRASWVAAQTKLRTPLPATAMPPLVAGPGGPVTIRTWCVQCELPDSFADHLEEASVRGPEDLVELTEADIEGLCANCKGLKVGEKGRFKRLVRALPPPPLPAEEPSGWRAGGKSVWQ